MASQIYSECLVVLRQGALELERRNFAVAERLFAKVALRAKSLAQEEGLSLSPLILCYTALLRQYQGRDAEVNAPLEVATTLLDKIPDTAPSPDLYGLMADVLRKLKHYSRAIPFYERAIQANPEGNPAARADRLWRLGECYSRVGLSDHSALALRAALKLLRDCPGDPRLAAVLLTLGNALRKTTPAEAERLYLEAAEIHEKKGQFESATSAWVNLGVLCAEQDRHQEALAWYEKTLRIRQSSRFPPPARIASVLNNIANCHRRMGNLSEAMPLVNRAIELIKADGGDLLASAYHSRGLILRDEGKHEEAVEWFRNAYAQRMSAASPAIESAANDLEEQIAALRSLGRIDEADAATNQREKLLSPLKDAPQSSINVDAVSAQPNGAVIIELALGTGSNNISGRRDAEELAGLLSKAVAHQDGDYYGGRVTFPESTTLMLYGDKAEALFKNLEPVLLDHPLCRGARITIRQGSQAREVVLPGYLM